MIKVGIITLHGLTLHGVSNHGNLLQNYALVKTLQQMGHEVNTIVVKNSLNNLVNTKSLIKRIFKKRRVINYFLILKSFISVIETLKYRDNILLKNIKSEEFSLEYLNEVFIDEMELPNIIDNYDYFIAGSDQIWNENWTRDYYFLNFSPKGKNLAYAASIGNDTISNGFKKYLKDKLVNLNSISVREKFASEVIESIMGIKPQVVLDPTFLVSLEDWISVAKKSKITFNGNYLLTYFIGDAPLKEIRFFANKFNLKIVNLFNPTSFKNSFLSSSVEDFLKLFSGADFVMTDSYHGTIFSILFKKRFVVTSKKDMNTRIHTILEIFNLEDRLDNIDSLIAEIDIDKINEILESMKKKVLSSWKKRLNNFFKNLR